MPASPGGFSGNSYDNTRRSRRRHLAARGVHRAAQGARPSRAGGSLVQQATLEELIGQAGLGTYQEGDGVRWLMASRRLQALHRGGLPRGVPDRGALPHRVRHRGRAGGRVQRLRLLRARVPVRRARPARGATGASWKCTLCYDRLKDEHGTGVRAGLPDQLDPVRRPRRAARARRAARRATLTEAGAEKAPALLHGADDGIGGAGAFFLLLDEPEVYGLPPDPVDTTARPRLDWAAVARPRCGLGVAIAAAVFGGRR